MYKLITIMIGSLLPAANVIADKQFSEADMSTLFTTAAVRHKIDAQRRGMASSSGAIQHVSPSNIKVNGIVKRSDGKSTVWVNGRNNMAHSTVDGVKVLLRQRRTDSVALYVDGKLVRIKPGETWSEDKASN
jgi:hypothetical protein